MLDDDEFLVPTLGDPTTAWTHMPPSEQQDSIALTHAQRRGEDAKDCCLNDSVVAFSKQLKTNEKDMTIKNMDWRLYRRGLQQLGHAFRLWQTAALFRFGLYYFVSSFLVYGS